jgi:hypothetical protein
MGVYEGQGQLARAMKDLLARWAEAKSNWDDANSAQIEKSLLEPLELDVRNATAAMTQMAQMLQQAERDCE